MVLPSGQPKLMDFGIAKIPAAQLTSAGEFFGTPSYMSPEQATGEPLDARSDVFSLGAVLYLLLTGVRAFDAPSVPGILARVAKKDPTAPSKLTPGLPAVVDDIVARALAKDSAQRYASAHMLAEDIAGRPRGPPSAPSRELDAASARGRDVALEPARRGRSGRGPRPRAEAADRRSPDGHEPRAPPGRARRAARGPRPRRAARRLRRVPAGGPPREPGRAASDSASLAARDGRARAPRDRLRAPASQRHPARLRGRRAGAGGSALPAR